MKEEIIKTTIRVRRGLWAKVRGQAVKEGYTTQEVITHLLNGWTKGNYCLDTAKKTRRGGKGKDASKG